MFNKTNGWVLLGIVLGLSACDPADEGVALETETAAASKFLRAENPIPNQYIVVMADNGKRSAFSMVSEVSSKFNADVTTVYNSVINGFAVRMTEAEAQALSLDPSIKFVEEDGIVEANDTQSPATWGLDRVDARSGLDNSYTFNFDGTDVHAYIIDTGIRATHNEFTGRIGNGFDAISNDTTPEDCNGHGTHVAGTVGGTTYGVAKNVTLHGVRVLGCNGSGSISGVIAGVDWVAENAISPAVGNMSLGGGASSALDNAVAAAVNAGVTMVVAAGNSNASACSASPAREESAITVGATTQQDVRSSFSNFGTCVDIFAPGSGITSAGISNDTSTRDLSGTSMASPHVAGAAALFLDENPNATPSQVANALTQNATSGALSAVGSGSPNLLLYTLFSGSPPPPDPDPTPTPDPDPAPAPGCSYEIDFESGASGWTTGGNCSTGTFILGTPTQVVNEGIITQVDGDHTSGSGTAAFTASNSSAGINDVDNGECILTSPAISVDDASTLSAWYFHGQRDADDDPNDDYFELEVSTNGGTSFSSIVSIGDDQTAAAWTKADASIPAGSSVQLRIRVADGPGPGDLIEAGLDDVSICPQ